MMRILIIEDDLDQALLVQETLTENSSEYAFDTVTSGRAALEKDLSLYDAILMDYNLPDMTGLEILREISNRPHGPVIMVTGEEIIELAVQALREGAEDFVIKSLELQQLLPHILDRTINNVQRRKVMEEIEQREREKKIQIETLKRIMMTLAHHINNAIMPVTFSAELCERSGYAQESVQRLVETCLRETRRITAIIERFERFVESEEFKYTDYLDLKNAMFDVEDKEEDSEDILDTNEVHP